MHSKLVEVCWLLSNTNVFYLQALHEALIRQEELLAYIDRQEEARFRVNQLLQFHTVAGQIKTLILPSWFCLSLSIAEKEVLLVKKSPVYRRRCAHVSSFMTLALLLEKC